MVILNGAKRRIESEVDPRGNREGKYRDVGIWYILIEFMDALTKISMLNYSFINFYVGSIHQYTTC